MRQYFPENYHVVYMVLGGYATIVTLFQIRGSFAKTAAIAALPAPELPDYHTRAFCWGAFGGAPAPSPLSAPPPPAALTRFIFVFAPRSPRPSLLHTHPWRARQPLSCATTSLPLAPPHGRHLLLQTLTTSRSGWRCVARLLPLGQHLPPPPLPLRLAQPLMPNASPSPPAPCAGPHQGIDGVLCTASDC